MTLEIAEARPKCPPVLVLAFNRPDTTRQVFEVLRGARPEALYFAVDGARDGKHEESARVEQVQSLTAMIDWECQVRTLFRKTNRGCKLAVSEAISWFFGQVEAGIILEDDCVAHPSFFAYASELLERYRDEERVLMVSGDNFQKDRGGSDDSYYFSRYAHIWGWATWRRAWKHYDHEMKAWPNLRDGGGLAGFLRDRGAANYWSGIFEDTYRNRNTSWAYRWQFCIWAQKGLVVLPRCNLVSNVGFGEFATHTRAVSPWASLPVEPMSFPLVHPRLLEWDDGADAYTHKAVFSPPALWKRLLERCRRIAGNAAGTRDRRHGK